MAKIWGVPFIDRKTQVLSNAEMYAEKRVFGHFSAITLVLRRNALH